MKLTLDIFGCYVVGRMIAPRETAELAEIWIAECGSPIRSLEKTSNRIASHCTPITSSARDRRPLLPC
jgi:hypothetical protein